LKFETVRPVHSLSVRRASRGLTLLELLMAIFIFMVGIMGVLMALPTGTNAASWVIFQDAAIHLSQSKFAEFRRDRVDPSVDLADGSGYMNGIGTTASGKPAGKQEPLKGNGWRDFAHTNPTDTYYHFDDITRYEWKVDQSVLKSVGAGAAGAPAGHLAPQFGGGNALDLYSVTIVVHMKGTTREFRYTQYMLKYE